MWQQTAEMAKRHDQNAGRWLRLQSDGDRAVVVFLGEPHPREVCFVDGKYVEFDEKLKAEGHKASLRIAINVALLESGEVKVLELGVMFFKDLVRVKEKYGLEKWAFEVQRHGAPKDPKTSYSILPEQALTPEQQAAFQSLEREDLANLYAAEKSEPPKFGSYDTKEPGVVDVRIAQGFAQQLKALPREAVERFLQKLNIQKIKDLPAAQLEKARALVSQLESEFAARDTSTEVDPFAL
jgi:hypothetical protein